MWLINADTYRLVEVNHPEDQTYAILSHTWSQDGEVSFDDMKELDVAMASHAWPKVFCTCSLARKQGIDFVWIDTVCIDKRSSAELTEAINSMFDWYKGSKVCYVYLDDLPESPNENSESRRAKEQLHADLRRCRWFSRGWTLQELIAPRNVEFYDRSWAKRGTKDSLRFHISTITEINMSVLANSEELSMVPVARKMSWAAGRQTTRIEDIAYSLFGIFDVNMPLIYGEGSKAFIRLQEAIAQSTNDLSLFAWSEDERNPEVQSYYGVFAQSPQQFIKCRRLESITDPLRHDRQSFALTNRGVEFQTCLKMDRAEGDYLMHLYCKDTAIERPQGRAGVIAIRLVKTSSGFARHWAEKVFIDDEEAQSQAPQPADWDPFLRSVSIPKVITSAESLRLHNRFADAFRFRIQAPHGVTCECTTYNPRLRKAGRDPESLRPSYWDPATHTFLTESYEPFTGMLYVTFSGHSEPFIVLCGFRPDDFASAPRIGGPSATQLLRPWVALEAKSPWLSESGQATPATLTTADLQAIIAQKTSLHYPHFLSRAGQIIRARLLLGTALPTAAALPLTRPVSSDIALPISRDLWVGVGELIHRVDEARDDIYYGDKFIFTRAKCEAGKVRVILFKDGRAVNIDRNNIGNVQLFSPDFDAADLRRQILEAKSRASTGMSITQARSSRISASVMTMEAEGERVHEILVALES